MLLMGSTSNSLSPLALRAAEQAGIFYGIRVKDITSSFEGNMLMYLGAWARTNRMRIFLYTHVSKQTEIISCEIVTHNSLN